jgi:hypothetical protein
MALHHRQSTRRAKLIGAIHGIGHNDRGARVQPGMRTHTTSIEIQAPPSDAFAFVADGEKLPLWAIGFAKAIEPDGVQWNVTLASGQRLPLRIDSDPRLASSTT